MKITVIVLLGIFLLTGCDSEEISENGSMEPTNIIKLTGSIEQYPEGCTEIQNEQAFDLVLDLDEMELYKHYYVSDFVVFWMAPTIINIYDKADFDENGADMDNAVYTLGVDASKLLVFANYICEPAEGELARPQPYGVKFEYQ